MCEPCTFYSGSESGCQGNAGVTLGTSGLKMAQPPIASPLLPCYLRRTKSEYQETTYLGRIGIERSGWGIKLSGSQRRIPMLESDSAAARVARSSDAEEQTMSGANPEVSESYLREQLEKRRVELASVCTEEPARAPFLELLQEVDSAIHRMDEGIFGICEVCDGTVEKERIIADPMVRVCLDCLTDTEKRALEQDLELASRVQRALLPASSTRFRDWQIHYEYKS